MTKYKNNRTLIEEEIKTLALSLELEQTSRHTCPQCKAKHELSFRIQRIPEGLLYNCFRAKCGLRGFISSIPGTTSVDKSAPKTKTFVPKEYKGTFDPIPLDVLSTMEERYGLTAGEFAHQGIRYDSSRDRLVMPLFDFRGEIFGYETKAMPGCSDAVKAIRYGLRETTGIHYARKGQYGSESICLVEDVLSAVKVSRYVAAVALLGHNLTDVMVSELRKQTDTLILMLDNDVQKKALYYRKKYKFFFRNFLVVLLSNDPKETDDTELKLCLGVQ